MGMSHNYTFLDRATADGLWALTWKTVLKRHPSRWFSSDVVGRGAYGGGNDSLRSLLAFAVDTEPTDEQLDEILATLTVAATMQRCTSQFWTMEELLKQILCVRSQSIFSVEINDISGVISVAARAFLDQRISVATLWTTAKLHSVDFGNWVKLKSNELKTIQSALPWERMFEPIYRWQDETACLNDEWTNCLGVTQTHLFANFIDKAYRENWSTCMQPGKRNGAETSRFRDFPDSVLLARSMRHRFRKLQRPCVYRMWS